MMRKWAGWMGRKKFGSEGTDTTAELHQEGWGGLVGTFPHDLSCSDANQGLASSACKRLNVAGPQWGRG